MCRFAAYFGQKAIVLDELLVKPDNSLVKQSHAARESSRGINADGFGVAWYDFDIDNRPGIFKSTQPAWNDNNLKHLSQKIRSSCFLAHVRASTIGDVNRSNCHPFAFEDYALVHNGTIGNFESYKRKFIDKIDENLFLNIKGNTDSEYFFSLIMHFLQHNNNLETSVKKAIDWVVKLQKDSDEFSKINIVVTNGQEIIATRFSSKAEKALSLRYYSESGAKNQISSLILSSESLEINASWDEVPENSYIYLNKNNMHVKINSL